MGAALVTNPIEVVKTRLQLNTQTVACGSPGMIATAGSVIRSEGFLALWKGVGASLLREGTYSTIRFGSYKNFKNLFIGPDDDGSFGGKLLAGGCAGGIGSAITTPTDVVRVRMQGSAEGTRYSSTSAAFVEIARTQGLRGLFRGTAPNVTRAVILTASQLASYDEAKRAIERSGAVREGMAVHFLASTAAGLVTAITTTPVDCVKTRYMNASVAYKGPLDCAAQALRSEGLRGLYKGFLPTWMRIGPHTVVSICILEQLLLITGLKPM